MLQLVPRAKKQIQTTIKMAWERQAQELAQAEPLVKKVKDGQEFSNDESQVLADRLNSPKFYFNEAALARSMSLPDRDIE